MDLESNKSTSSEEEMEVKSEESSEEEMETESEEEKKRVDVRRFYCEFCGLSRSKRALITAHMHSAHPEEAAKAEADREKEERMKEEDRKRCKECGVWFRKPAHLKQHMLSHSSEHWIPFKRTPKCEEASSCYILNGPVVGWVDLLRSSFKIYASISRCPCQKPFSCPMEDCKSSYGRKDHLNRHLLSHQGKTFSCPVESCNSRFVIKANINRHVKDFHECTSPDEEQRQKQKEFVCSEVGCGKTFRYPSKLAAHEKSHVKLECCEVICMEQGCMKHFSNVECLKQHMKSCHSYITCETCGKKQLKKNMKRHIRTHEERKTLTAIKCSFEDCKATFSNKSNLKKHVMAVHEDSRPFVCSVSVCGERFAYRHVRDNHEKTSMHLCCHGDFEEADEEFHRGERGGRKRKNVTVDMLLRKRVGASPDSSNVQDHSAPLEDASEYLRWLLSGS